jgi:hypothetical protein
MIKKTAKDNADTRDIVYYLAMAAPAAIQQVKAANLPEIIGLTGGNLQKDAEFTARWIKGQVKYKRDGFNEQNIQFPSALLKSGFGDCKSFSLLFLSVMSAAGYNGGFRFASYKPNKQLTHVYNYFTDAKGNTYAYDACVPDLKESTKATHKKDMKVNYIAGIPTMIEDSPEIGLAPVNMRRCRIRGIEGYLDDNGVFMSEPEYIGRRKLRERLNTALKKAGDIAKKAGRGAGNLGKKAFQGYKKVALVVPRQSFRALVALNFRGLATRINKLNNKQPDKVKEFWLKFGGSYGDLMSAVNKGKGKKPLLIKKSDPRLQADKVEISGPYMYNPEYLGEPLTIGAAITAALPLIQIIVKKLGENNVPAEGDEAKDNDGELPPPDNDSDIPDNGKFTPTDPEGEEAEAYGKSGGMVYTNTKGDVQLRDKPQPEAVATGGGLLSSKNILIFGALGVGALLLLRKKR